VYAECVRGVSEWDVKLACSARLRACRAGIRAGLRHRLSLLLLLTACRLSAHAPPTPLAVPPLRVQVNRLLDANGALVLLRGVTLPLLETSDPPPLAFRVIQQRWNMNAVRLPVSVAAWLTGRQAYLDRVAGLVAAGNREGLVVILTAQQDGSPMPDATTLDFWRTVAALFKNTPGLIFGLFNEPRPQAAGDRVAAWHVWLAGMQPLADAIRAAGATQVIAAPAIQDGLDFQGFGPGDYLRDSNVIYEVHTTASTDDARDRNFGFLVNNIPIFAGAWGGGCALTSDDTLTAMSYFDQKKVSWTVSDFTPGGLIANFGDFTVSKTCATGSAVLLWMTGDPQGFGSIDPTQTANAAGGFPGPIAPGQIVALYGQLVGPQDALGPHLTAGRVDTALGEVQVFFDGQAAPILMASYFQVNVQVPYEVAGRKQSVVQLVYRGVPSNTIALDVTGAAPGIFTTFTGGSDVLALNQDGSVNGPDNPAARGSIAALFATGAGQTTPASVTGVPATVGTTAAPASVTLAGRQAEILYAGPAPTLVGVTQVNARVPADAPAGRAAVVLTVGAASSRSGVVLWVK